MFTVYLPRTSTFARVTSWTLVITSSHDPFLYLSEDNLKRKNMKKKTSKEMNGANILSSLKKSDKKMKSSGESGWIKKVVATERFPSVGGPPVFFTLKWGTLPSCYLATSYLAFHLRIVVSIFRHSRLATAARNLSFPFVGSAVFALFRFVYFFFY